VQYAIGGRASPSFVSVTVSPLSKPLSVHRVARRFERLAAHASVAYGIPRTSQKIAIEVEVADTQLKIAPIGEGLSLKARAYDALKTAIMNMNIYADEAELRLDERDLSQRFGVSRTPLREALAQLDQEGLVRIVARRGIFIVRKTKAEILDMITVWAALESMAARLATQHASAAEMARLRPLVDKFSQDEIARKLGEYSEANIKFHQAIIGLGKCPLIVDITNGLFFHMRAIRQRTISEQDRAKRSIVDHKEIVAALEARDTERAERLVREHTLRLRDHVDRFVDLD
jgi:DNA-binding GntR family transcriptional regulator